MEEDIKPDDTYCSFSVKKVSALVEIPAQTYFQHHSMNNCASACDRNVGTIVSQHNSYLDKSLSSKLSNTAVKAQDSCIGGADMLPASLSNSHDSFNGSHNSAFMAQVNESSAYQTRGISGTRYTNNDSNNFFVQPAESDCQSFRKPVAETLSHNQSDPCSVMADRNPKDYGTIEEARSVAEDSAFEYPVAISLQCHPYQCGVESSRCKVVADTASTLPAEQSLQKLDAEHICSPEKPADDMEEDLKSMYPQLFVTYSDTILQSVGKESMTAGKWSFVFCLKLLTTDHQPRLVEWIDRSRLLFQVSEGRTKTFIGLWAHKNQVVREKQLKGTWDNFTARIRYKSTASNMYFDFDYKESTTDPRFKDMPKKRVFKFAEAFNAIIDVLDPPKSNLVGRHTCKAYAEPLLGRSDCNNRTFLHPDMSADCSANSQPFYLSVLEDGAMTAGFNYPHDIATVSREVEPTACSVRASQNTDATNTFPTYINSQRVVSNNCSHGKGTLQTSILDGFAVNNGFRHTAPTPQSVKLANTADHNTVLETMAVGGHVPFYQEADQPDVEYLIPRTISHSDSDSDPDFSMELPCT